jgi:hypothetical protein
MSRELQQLGGPDTRMGRVSHPKSAISLSLASADSRSPGRDPCLRRRVLLRQVLTHCGCDALHVWQHVAVCLQRNVALHCIASPAMKSAAHWVRREWLSLSFHQLFVRVQDCMTAQHRICVAQHDPCCAARPVCVNRVACPVGQNC